MLSIYKPYMVIRTSHLNTGLTIISKTFHFHVNLPFVTSKRAGILDMSCSSALNMHNFKVGYIHSLQNMFDKTHTGHC